MTVMSVREFNANTSKALSRVEAGEAIEISKHGRVFAEIRPKRGSKLDDPVFRAAYERMVAGLHEGVPGLDAPFTYAERTER